MYQTRRGFTPTFVSQKTFVLTDINAMSLNDVDRFDVDEVLGSDSQIVIVRQPQR